MDKETCEIRAKMLPPRRLAAHLRERCLGSQKPEELGCLGTGRGVGVDFGDKPGSPHLHAPSRFLPCSLMMQ